MSESIEVVLVTMFEPPGDMPGELSLFRQREALLPYHLSGFKKDTLHRSKDGRLLVVVAGVGTGNTAISMMLLGLNARLDLTKAWWIVAGIAGGNPRKCSLGCPVWADYCVDGDLAFELDARDMPAEWQYGILPLGAKEPFGKSTMPKELFGSLYQVFQLPSVPMQRAYKLTKSIELYDDEALAEARGNYTDAGAQCPAVAVGSTLAAARFWHGAHHNAWAEHWVKHWTENRGDFFTSGMEDSGTLHALAKLSELGRVDDRRVMILRTVSNYTMPPAGGNAVASLTGEDHGGEYPGHAAALENGYRAASAVYRDILYNPEAWQHAMGL